jgi:hypothetical protein
MIISSIIGASETKILLTLKINQLDVSRIIAALRRTTLQSVLRIRKKKS